MVQGYVYDDVSFVTVPAAFVQAENDTATLHTASASDGYYSITAPEGMYDMTASAFGYETAMVNNIAITTSVIVDQYFPLTAIPVYTISGIVSDALSMYILDIANNFDLIGQFSISNFDQGRGLEMDCDANLWTIDYSTQIVYQISFIYEDNGHGESTMICNYDTLSWLDETLELGQSVTQTFSIVNYGSQPLCFELLEGFENFTPSPMANNQDEDLLIVNEDRNSTEAFKMALDELGYTHAEVTADDFEDLTVSELLGYEVLLYVGVPSTGNVGEEQELVVDYLDAGGRLLLAENDFLYNYPNSDLTLDYLQLGYVSDAGSRGTLIGHDIMEGINPNITLDPFPDDFLIFGSAVGIFESPSNLLYEDYEIWSGSRIEYADYRAVFFAWDFHYTGQADDQIAIVKSALDWLIGSTDLTWLSTDPTEGTIASLGYQNVTITFDTSEIGLPGQYVTSIIVESNDPYNDELRLPVVLTTTAPDNFGFGAAASGCGDDMMWSFGGINETGDFSNMSRYHDEGLPCSGIFGYNSMWLTQTPITGTVSSGEASNLDLTWHGNVAIPGTYYAQVTVSHNDPFVFNAIFPVTMTVDCTDCGTLEGLITDGHTDKSLIATINVTDGTDFDHTVKTDDYRMSLLPGVYTVTVSNYTYFSKVTTVTIVSDMVTVQNFALYLEPILSIEKVAPTVSPGLIEYDLTVYNTGSMATIIGWGALEEGGLSPDELYQVDVPIITNEACQAALSAYDITDNMLCAGYAEGGKDSCQGDSGGPLMVPGDFGWQHAGIVSWGLGCAKPNQYGVYARTAQFIDWIEENGVSTTSRYVFNSDYMVTADDGYYYAIGDLVDTLITDTAIFKLDKSELVSVQDIGMTVTQEVTVSNWGNVELNWQLAEDVLEGLIVKPGFISLGASNLALSIQPAGEHALTDKTAPAQTGFSSPTHRIAAEKTITNEGFESGTVPPPDWYVEINDEDYTWDVTGLGFNGRYAATVVYNPALFLQDEWFISPEVTLYGGQLSFWSLGSTYWCRDDEDNCDLEIWFKADGMDDMFVGVADDDWLGNFVWSQSTFDLTETLLANDLVGQQVRVAFRYSGINGAQVSLDDVTIEWFDFYTACLLPTEISWLNVSSDAGTLEGNENSTFEVTFDSKNLDYGYYQSALCLTSNDLDNNLMVMPVEMFVEHAPTISLTKTVGIEPATCADGDEIVITESETVYYLSMPPRLP